MDVLWDLIRIATMRYAPPVFLQNVHLYSEHTHCDDGYLTVNIDYHTPDGDLYEAEIVKDPNNPGCYTYRLYYMPGWRTTGVDNDVFVAVECPVDIRLFPCNGVNSDNDDNDDSEMLR